MKGKEQRKNGRWVDRDDHRKTGKQKIELEDMEIRAQEDIKLGDCYDKEDRQIVRIY